MGIQTLDLEKFESKAHNIYEAVAIASARSRQINDDRKLEFNNQLAPISKKEVEDDTMSNQEKLELSMQFEKRPKPTLHAIKEIMDDDLNFRYRTEPTEE